MHINFYLGGEEYFVMGKDGTHHIVNVRDYENNASNAIVFTGSYSQCMEERIRMEIEYQESRF